MAEAVHRAHNDLGSIAAMLRLQARAMTDAAARAALLDAEARMRALSSLKTRLNARAAGVATVVNSGDFLNGLAVDLRDMHFGQRPVTLDVRTEPHRFLVAQAKPLGLIVNQLVVNALKYAFPGDRNGTVNIAFERRDGDCALTIEDDGIGVDPAAPPRGTGLGRRMVRAPAAQIGGGVQIGPGADGGTERTVRWRSLPGECRP